MARRAALMTWGEIELSGELCEGELVEGRYRIDAELGRGGMGIVYRAFDTGLEREVALKVMTGALRDNGEVALQFRLEAKTLAALRHENVVQVHALGSHAGALFYAMEYVRGEDLAAIIGGHSAAGGHVPIHRATTILALIARALDTLHLCGIIHRDVKPSNIVIEEDTGRPVLVDFGLAVTIHPHEVHLGPASGTPAYMPPEQGLGMVMGTELASRADVYAFACTAFELFTGNPPFRAREPSDLLRQHALSEPPQLSSFRPELRAFDAAFARALAKSPTERFATCREFVELLDLRKGPFGGEGAVTAREKVGKGESAAALRVLIVDDDELSRATAARALDVAFGGTNLRRLMAASGAAAIRMSETAPDLVILDFDMPGLNGLDTLSMIRALPGGAATRVLVVSARANEADRWKFSVLGVRDFVSKAAGLRQLVDALRAIGERNFWLAPITCDLRPEERAPRP